MPACRAACRLVVPDAETAPALARLAAQALAGTGRRWSAEQIRDFGTPPRGAVLADAALAQGLLILALGPDEAEVVDLGVVPAARRHGLGRALLAAAEAEARARGATRMLLEVATDNAPARALYAASGYVPVGGRRGYYLRPDGSRADALVLARRLAP